MAKVIKLDDLIKVCETYEVGQCALTNELLVKVGVTKRGDDICKPLLDYVTVYEMEI